MFYEAQHFRLLSSARVCSSVRTEWTLQAHVPVYRQLKKAERSCDKRRPL